MYTVVRVTTDPSKLGELERVGRSFNGIRPAVYEGIRRAGDGFACEVSGDECWEQHVISILSFVREFSEPLRRAVELGASVTFDVAIAPQDRKDLGKIVLALRFDAALLAALAEPGIALEVSLYP